MKVTIAYFLVMLFLTSCLKEKSLKLSFTAFSPVALNDKWSISTMSKENMDSSLLNQAFELFYSKTDLLMATSLIVIRNGKIVSEAYAKDENDINRIENIQSCTKSITSLLVGISIKQGLIDGVNMPLYKYIPEAFNSELEKKKLLLEIA